MFIGPQLTFTITHVLVDLVGVLDNLELTSTLTSLELTGSLEEVAPEFVD